MFFPCVETVAVPGAAVGPVGDVLAVAAVGVIVAPGAFAVGVAVVVFPPIDISFEKVQPLSATASAITAIIVISNIFCLTIRLSSHISVAYGEFPIKRLSARCYPIAYCMELVI
jgi:hypothetical protein